MELEGPQTNPTGETLFSLELCVKVSELNIPVGEACLPCFLVERLFRSNAVLYTYRMMS
jgi:hypothetical protein